MKNFVLLILLLVFITSSFTILLIAKYIDPFSVSTGIILSFLLSIILSISTFFSLIFYSIKKIHYRWQVLLSHISSSFRQWFFIATFVIWVWLFIRMWVPIYFSWLLFFILLISIESFIQNIKS
jgi:hypothetical protein